MRNKDFILLAEPDPDMFRNHIFGIPNQNQNHKPDDDKLICMKTTECTEYEEREIINRLLFINDRHSPYNGISEMVKDTITNPVRTFFLLLKGEDYNISVLKFENYTYKNVYAYVVSLDKEVSDAVIGIFDAKTGCCIYQGDDKYLDVYFELYKISRK